MLEDRVYTVRRIVAEYVRGPSLRHVRDFQNLEKVSREIVTALDREYGIWRKWDGLKDQLAKLSLGSWVPLEDMVAFLNSFPGPKLTKTDMQQRILALEEEESIYPQDEFRPACEELYRREVDQGSDMVAILLALRGLTESLYDQRSEDRRQRWEVARVQAKLESQ